MISFAEPEEDGIVLYPISTVMLFSSSFFICSDIIRAISEAINIVKMGKHDPFQAHERIKTFYNWEEVTSRTEEVYDAVLKSRQMNLMERIQRCVL
jgi:hypothetical protein